MSRANVPTLLNLDRAARMINLNPVHFSGAYGSTFWPLNANCSDLWPQHSWQSEELIVSREMFAEAIHDAEMDIINALGYAPAPMYFIEEFQPYKLRYDGVWWQHRSFHTKFGKMIAGGVRGSTEIDSDVSVTYSDEDLDGWNEIGTVTVNTSVTDPKEIKIYFAGYEGDPLWEIKPLKSVEISGGVATIKAHSWLFIKPNLWEEYPTRDGYEGIDISTTANFVEDVDVYREYVDATVRSVQFIWEPGSCGSLTQATQDGMFLSIDLDTGHITPVPASYENNNWVKGLFSPNYPPSGMRFWYYAGLQDQLYLDNRSLDPLSEYWAQTILWLAVARLELPPCSCGAATHYFHEWQRDLARSNRNERNLLSFTTLENPFGTRVGAVRAWERVTKVAGEGFGSESI